MKTRNVPGAYVSAAQTISPPTSQRSATRWAGDGNSGNAESSRSSAPGRLSGRLRRRIRDAARRTARAERRLARGGLAECARGDLADPRERAGERGELHGDDEDFLVRRLGERLQRAHVFVRDEVVDRCWVALGRRLAHETRS